MRIRLLICLILIVGSTMGGFPFIARVAAQEIPQCIFEGQPCGTPQQLYERIQHCLQEPNLCRDVRTNRAGDDRGNGSSHPARGPSSPDRVTTLLPTKPTVRSQDVRPRQPASVSMGKVPAAEAPTAELPGGAADAVTRAAGELSLDPTVKALNDTMPDNTAAVEHRLVLRRTRAPGIDTRQRTPTPAEIIDALEPAKDSHR